MFFFMPKTLRNVKISSDKTSSPLCCARTNLLFLSQILKIRTDLSSKVLRFCVELRKPFNSLHLEFYLNLFVLKFSILFVFLKFKKLIKEYFMKIAPF